MTAPQAERPLTKTERAVRIVRAAPEWTVRQIGNLAPTLMVFAGVILARATAGHESTSSAGMIIAAILCGVALALAYSQGHDRGEAKRVTSTTVNMSVKLADGYAIVRQESPSHD